MEQLDMKESVIEDNNDDHDDDDDIDVFIHPVIRSKPGYGHENKKKTTSKVIGVDLV